MVRILNAPEGRWEMVHRAGLLASVADHLAAGRRVAVRGVAGVGVTTLLSALRQSAERSVWVTSPSGGSYAVLAEVLAALPQEHLNELPAPQRQAAEAVLRRVEGPPDQVALRFAVATLVGRWAGNLGGGRAGDLAERALLVVDDAHLIDAGSADALKRAPVGVVLGTRTALPVLADVEVVVPRLSGDEVAELLAEAGLPCRLAGQVHRASGGFPGWALEIGRAMAEGSSCVPASTQRRLAELPERTRRTMLLAALARTPTIALLRGAGRPDADQDLAPARTSGLVEVSPSGEVSFTASVLRDALLQEASWSERSDGHRALADVTTDLPERARHRALAMSIVDKPAIAELTAAAAAARADGDRGTAAELGLLTAQASALVAAAKDAAAAGRLDLARQAEARLERLGTAAERVRARLAIIEALGQGIDDSSDTFARAFADAAGDPRLEAEIHLFLAIKANVADGDPGAAREEAMRAGELAVQGDDPDLLAAALTMQARIERIVGAPGAEHTLARALAVTPTIGDLINISPQFLAARHALFDDRLAAAHATLLGLLPLAERSGVASDRVDILRGLAEVEVRSGRCGRALVHAAHALSLTDAARLSPGPAWYTAATAEAAGGDMRRAQTYATLGVQASREDHDVIFLARNLHVLGHVRLVGGDAEGAAESLSEVRDLELAQGVVDPSVLRWHGDLVIALALTGQHGRARRLLEETRPVAVRLARHGVLAALDRAEGVLLSTEGDLEGAGTLLDSASAGFVALGLVMEHGRTMLDLAHVARRRRRRTRARAALTEATALFAAAQARPWSRLARDAAERLDSAPARTAALTDTEARVATLVAAGSSNREVSANLYLSVKTVEATLTRVYRKLGVRSRTQLGIALQGIPPFPGA
ncbi:LuxR C-terminal-related transcriptional regulator [Nonomuraea sp. NPDC050556]|uniref:LuxR C-terminal-related transcriptional regulator n=1 Tax=Nonomuraea sp. NPDC050556 TaxID=3364369 RepID=UPI00379AC475